MSAMTKNPVKQQKQSKDDLSNDLCNDQQIYDISEVFDLDGNLIKIQKTDDESREVYLTRVDYILKNYKPNSGDSKRSDFEYVKRISLIWRNITIFNMTYPLSITKKIF